MPIYKVDTGIGDAIVKAETPTEAIKKARRVVWGIPKNYPMRARRVNYKSKELLESYITEKWYRTLGALSPIHYSKVDDFMRGKTDVINMT